MRLFREVASLAAPPRCGACAAPCEGEAALCPDCESTLMAGPVLIEPGPPGVDLAVASARYEGVVREVAHGLKYAQRLPLAPAAARAMAAACPPDQLRGAIVPVPASPWRRRWRGFDPAEEIAVALARLTGLELSECLRRRGRSRQVGRPRAERLADPPRTWTTGAVPARALLVDDVHTTGATLRACASALRAGGCEAIVAMTLARAL